MKILVLLLTIFVSNTTDGAKNMIGFKIGLIGRINTKKSELNLSQPIGVHCSSTSTLCSTKFYNITCIESPSISKI